MKRKGFVSILELIVVVGVLFASFSIFFPGVSYQNRWSEGLVFLKSRDVLLTLDRTNNLYNYSFDSDLLKNFLDRVVPTNRTNLLYWSELDGAIKPTVSVACNCTDEQLKFLWKNMNKVKVNGRDIGIIYCWTNLENINEKCFAGSDVLLIWGYKDLTNYRQQLQNYLNYGRGIIEIMNFVSDPDTTQNSIFGIGSGGDWGDVDYDTIFKPDSAVNMTYQPYKLFYHVPLLLKAPIEGTTVGCTVNMTGNFTLWSINYTFSICDGRTVYFDTNADGRLDSGPLIQGSNFNLTNITAPTVFYNFTLNYIDGNSIIYTSFKPSYIFNEFCRVPSYKRVVPTNDEFNRCFMRSVKKVGWGDDVRGYCVILNGTVGKTAWIADFSRDGLDKVGDDHKMLLASLLFWASDKRSITGLGNLKVGQLVPYINTANQDMFEVYHFSLGFGYPY